MNELNIFTCCDGVYKDFIPLFILSNLYHNDNCIVEVGVDRSNYSNIKKSLDILNNLYKDKFVLYDVKFGYQKINGKSCNSISNTIRFFTTPKIKTNYVYISDVDIINLQKNFINIHIENMGRTGLPYSNIVRPSSNRLSGLHFTPYENYYPIPDYSDLCEKNILLHDEVFLYELVKKRYPNFNLSETFRPVHGIHVSLNREPAGKLGWGMNGWKDQWIDFRKSEVFLLLEPTFTEMIKNKIKIIDNFYK